MNKISRSSSLQARTAVRGRSDAVALDAAGGAAVVSVPCPADSRAAAPPDMRAAYVLSVSAAPVRPALSRAWRPSLA